MELVNLLQFLNKVKELYAPDYATCDIGLVNFLNLLSEDEQFTQKINLGEMFIAQKTLDRYNLVDGVSRFLSLSLLLHAICECYKKTSTKNDKAIKIIRTKYLLNGSKTKLRLSESCQLIYEKIIMGERLSGKEKNTPVFKLYHILWTQIKEDGLSASKIFNMLGKLVVYMINVENVKARDLYYTINKDKKELDQLILIESFLKELDLEKDWKSFLKVFRNKTPDILLFFKDFFVTKFSFKQFYTSRLYENFSNYFITMQNYMPRDVIMVKLKRSATLYLDLLNVNLSNEKLRNALIQIKMHNGDDTYAYILNVYEDYVDGNLSESTFLEILYTIDEYLRNRQKNPNNVAFNELVQYLNAFITCK